MSKKFEVKVSSCPTRLIVEGNRVFIPKGTIYGYKDGARFYMRTVRKFNGGKKGQFKYYTILAPQSGKIMPVRIYENSSPLFFNAIDSTIKEHDLSDDKMMMPDKRFDGIRSTFQANAPYGRKHKSSAQKIPPRCSQMDNMEYTRRVIWVR